jgi:predicted ATPase/DNA-binding CsgD family transcriptional regulator
VPTANLPLLPTPLIGRRREVAVARRLLLTEQVRLLTLTGPPGVGKTSLALTVARGLLDRFEHGVRLVDLSPVADPGLVATTIAEALGAGGAGRPSARIASLVRDRHLLLVLDNFEHVVNAAPLLGELLAACPRLAVLVTSRVPLRLRWEHELPVPALDIQAPGRRAAAEAATVGPAVALFAQRARAVDGGFEIDDDTAPTISEICRQLDGLPLAIELAAARVRMLSPAEILHQLAGGADQPGQSASTLRLLAGGGRDLPARQRTLVDAVEWSHAHLNQDERVAFRRLAIFLNGCTIEAAEQVAQASWATFASLVEQSLLRRERLADGGVRLRMLQPIRQYALERLHASGERATVAGRHTACFLDLAERAAPELAGPAQAAWLDLLERERDNLQAVARRAVAAGDADTVLRLGAALWQFWWARSDAAEARERVGGVLALAALMPPSPARIRALHGAGVLAHELADYAGAESLFRQSLDLARRLDDGPAIVDVRSSHGWLAQQRGDYVRARLLLDQSLESARRLDDRARLAGVLARRGHVAFAVGEVAEARALLDEALDVARALADRRIVGDIVYSLGLTCHAERDLGRARACFEESRAIFEALDHRPALAQTLHSLAALATMEGDVAGARELFREVLLLARGAGNRRRLALALWAIAVLVGIEGDPALGVRLHAAGSTAIDALGVMLARPLRQLNEANMAPIYAALDAATLATARALGQAVSLDRAVDEALEWLGSRDDLVEDEVGSVRGAVESSRSVRAGMDMPSARPAGRWDVEALTRREREVAALLGRGLTNRQIADELVLTEGTANSYVKRVLRRLGFHSRSQVAAWAVERGLHTSGRQQ